MAEEGETVLLTHSYQGYCNSVCIFIQFSRYNNRFLSHVLKHETERLIRVAENLMNNFSVEFQEEVRAGENSTKLVNMAIKRKIKENLEK